MRSGQEKVLRPRAEIATLPLYNAGITPDLARQVSGRKDIVALASNENPYGCSPAVGVALAALKSSRYSDSASSTLRSALAEKLDISADRIVCGNGSEELISALCRAYLEKGDTVLTISPCFGLHEIEPIAAGAQVVKVPMTESFDYDIQMLVQELVKNPKIVFLSSPSNPVGKALTTPELALLLSTSGPDTLFVLDEAYFEFLDDDGADGLKVFTRHEHRHWVVLRTFSKAYGLAGLRVGYGATSNADIARAMRSALTPFNVNAAAQTAAIVALQDSTWMRDATARISRDRTLLAARLSNMGLRVIPSQTNFLFVELKVDAAPVAKDLLRRGIIVKPWMEAGYTHFLRVSIGTAEENERFAQELYRALGQK